MANLDNYLPCEFYEKRELSTSHAGFTTWQDAASSLWYFAVVTASGRVVLRSEGYSSEAARNNGMDSVTRNRDISERYSIVEEEENSNIWYVALKAGNRQEIARSCAYTAPATKEEAIAMCFSNYLEVVETASASNIVETSRASNIKNDNKDEYLPCVAYEMHDASKYAGFTAFVDDETNLHYFAMINSAGKVLLRSEGYSSEGGRNNGIESVMKNRDNHSLYAVVQGEDGLWYLVLKAGNRQEIARSCAFGTEGEAKNAIATYFTSYKDAPLMKAVVTKTTGEKTVTTVASDAHIVRKQGETIVTETKKSAADVKRTTGQTIVSEGSEASVTRTKGETIVTQTTGATLVTKTIVEIETPPPTVYIDEPTATEIDEYLPCEAYQGHGRNPMHEGFTTFTHNGEYYFAMVDDKGKVLLRSEGYTTESARKNGMESVMKNSKIAERWVEKKDEGGYYRILLAGNKQEIGRSCHYDMVAVQGEAKSVEMVDVVTAVAIAAPVAVTIEEVEKVVVPPVVVPEIKIPEPVVVVPKVKEPEPVVVAPLPVVEKPKPVIVDVPKPKPVVEVAKAAPIIEPVVEEVASGGFKWWWLLPLLALLGFFLFRNCGGCKKEPVIVPPAKVEVPTPPVTETAPVVAAAPCNCTTNPDPLFNIDPNATPKSLTRLGTNPEFGNSHALSIDDFYAKLVRRHKNNPVDREFLERVFKGMGYANGFADANKEMFSEVEVPAGTVGNMGYSIMHKSAYDRLDATGKDLLAFKIKSANGLDMHFMKTCGNHFFICPCK